MNQLKKLLPLLLALIAIAVFFPRQNELSTALPESAARSEPTANDAIAQAFAARRSSVPIAAAVTVEKLLSDDNKGSRHQRFIAQSQSGVSVLVAHNIDLAPRLDGLAVSDRIYLVGEYEWNEKGGVIHWTHRDPNGRHPDGYLEWRGRRYR